MVPETFPEMSVWIVLGKKGAIDLNHQIAVCIYVASVQMYGKRLIIVKPIMLPSSITSLLGHKPHHLPTLGKTIPKDEHLKVTCYISITGLILSQLKG